MTHHSHSADHPEIRVIRREVATHLLGLWKGTLKPSKPTLPPVSSWRWGEAPMPGEHTEWEWGEDGLLLLLHGFTWDDQEGFICNAKKTAEAATFKLSDGSVLSAKFAGWVGRSDRLDTQGATRVRRILIDPWQWEVVGHRPVLWMAPVAHLTVKTGNLTISKSENEWSSRHLALVGTHRFYAVLANGGRWWLVFEDRGIPLDAASVGTDIRALEFAVGQSLDVGCLLGINEHGVVVGAADLGYSARGQRRGEPPIPRETVEDRGVWAAVLVNQVAAALAQEQREVDPATLGTAAYLESVADANIHVQYLVAQIALEALASRLVEKPPPLVADTDRWRSLVSEIEERVRLLARDERSADVLLNKLNHNVWNASSGDVVVRAFERLAIPLGREELDEIPRRNVSAHSLVMYRKGEPEAQELADRLAIVRCLLVALIARAVGYTGPIEGWRWQERTKVRPPWWPVTDDEEAHLHYLAADDESVYDDDASGAQMGPVVP